MVLAYFKVLTQQMLVGLRKTTNNNGQDSWSLNGDQNLGFPNTKQKHLLYGHDVRYLMIRLELKILHCWKQPSDG
jgi:hypothetical protein